MVPNPPEGVSCFEDLRLDLEQVVEKIKQELKRTQKQYPTRKMPLITLDEYSFEPINLPEPREEKGKVKWMGTKAN